MNEPAGDPTGEEPTSERWFNLPNTLSAVRLALIPVFAHYVLEERMVHALVVFAVAGITDGIDGYLARAWNQRTELGAHLDPLADKALTLVAFTLLAFAEILPMWLLILAIVRDVGLVGGHFVTSHVWKVRAEVEPSFLGKANTTIQIVVLSFALLSEAALEALVPFASTLGTVLDVLVVVAGASILASGVHYLHREWELVRRARAEAEAEG